MGVKVKAPDKSVYAAMLSILADVPKGVANEARLYVAVPELPDRVRYRLRAVGATVVPDEQVGEPG